jgi:RNase P/RNase MRP subunit p29
MFSLAALGLALIAGTNALAATDVKSNTHEGKVVSITSDELVMTDSEGQTHSHNLTADAKLTLDGKACKAADLAPGTKIRVTTDARDTIGTPQIEALDKNAEFTSNSHEGKVVSITGDELVMTSKDGQKHSHELTSKAILTLDGKVCKAAELKPDTRIRVTIEEGDKNGVTRIEGLDKSAAFASSSREGKVISTTRNELVVMSKDGQRYSQKLTADAKLTLDGKVCKIADLKSGMRIRVTTPESNKNDVNRIEGLDKDLTFASR